MNLAHSPCFHKVHTKNISWNLWRQKNRLGFTRKICESASYVVVKAVKAQIELLQSLLNGCIRDSSSLRSSEWHPAKTKLIIWQLHDKRPNYSIKIRLVQKTPRRISKEFMLGLCKTYWIFAKCKHFCKNSTGPHSGPRQLKEEKEKKEHEFRIDFKNWFIHIIIYKHFIIFIHIITHYQVL